MLKIMLLLITVCNDFFVQTHGRVPVPSCYWRGLDDVAFVLRLVIIPTLAVSRILHSRSYKRT